MSNELFFFCHCCHSILSIRSSLHFSNENFQWNISLLDWKKKNSRRKCDWMKMFIACGDIEFHWSRAFSRLETKRQTQSMLTHYQTRCSRNQRRWNHPHVQYFTIETSRIVQYLRKSSILHFLSNHCLRSLENISSLMIPKSRTRNLEKDRQHPDIVMLI